MRVFILHLCLIHLSASRNDTSSSRSTLSRRRRRLQFEGMMEIPGGHLRGGRRRGKGKGGGAGAAGSGDGGGGLRKPVTREKALSDAAEEIVNNADRYNQWWTGPLNTDSFTFTPAQWGAQHVPGAQAIFTTSITQGGADRFIVSSPRDLILFFGTARKAFSGDIVSATLPFEIGPVDS